MPRKTSNLSKFRLRWTHIEDFAFLVYMCAASGNQTGEGFDALLIRVTLLFYFITVIPVFFKRIIINGYLRWLLLFYGYVALSCLWADPEFSGEHFNKFVQITVVVLGLSQRIKTIDDVKRYLCIYYLSLLYMVLMLYYKTPPWVWGTSAIGEVLGLNKNGLGLLAASGFIVSLFFVFETSNKFWRIVNVPIMAVFATVAVMSTSRKGLMMMPIGLVLYWFLSQKRNILQSKNLARIAGGLIVLIIILWAGTRYIMSSDLIIAQRMERTVNIMVKGETSDDESINERKFFIQKAEELFLKHPIFGAGSNGFESYMKEIHYSHVAYCHNNFWEMLSTLGIVGFLIFYYMHAKSLYYGLPWNRGMQNIRPLIAVLWILVAITVIFGWWWVYYYEVPSNYLFVLMYLACYVNRALPETKKLRARK